MTEQVLTSQLIKEITDCFHEPDISLIKTVLYFDGWSDYEECGGILVFRAIDDSFQIVHYGYCVMAEDNTNYFQLREVSATEAQLAIAEMQAAIAAQPEGGLF